jgi:hypothetical protein
MTIADNAQREDPHPDGYDVLQFAGIEPRTHYRSVSYRIDMLQVLEYKESAAIIYQVIYRWLDYRRVGILREVDRRCREGLPALTAAEVQERLWVSLSYTDLVRETGGALSQNTVSAALDYLVGTRGVLKRRKTRRAHACGYEYTIAQSTVRALLAKLPEFPAASSRRSGHGVSSAPGASQAATDASRHGAGSLPVGIGISAEETSTFGRTDGPCIGREAPHIGTIAPTLGTEPTQKWETLHKKTQDSVHTTPQQLQSPDAYQRLAAAAAARFFAQQYLSSQKPAERPASRHPLAEAPGQPVALAVEPPTDQAQPASTPTRAAESDAPSTAAPGEALTAIDLLDAFERLRGRAYTPRERSRALAAAHAVLRLSLPTPLSREWLQRIYTTFNDHLFQTWYGSLELHHLPQRESTGQIRLERWMQRLLAQDTRPGGDRMWKDRPHPLADVLRQSGSPGETIFACTAHPDDDLEAAAAHLAAQGLVTLTPHPSAGGLHA